MEPTSAAEASAEQAAAEPATDEAASTGIRHLTDLPDDALAAVLCECDAKGLAALAGVSEALREAALSDIPWHAALARDFDVPRTLSSVPRATYVALARGHASELIVRGLITDGGIDMSVLHLEDGSGLPAEPADGVVKEYTVPASVNASAMWVGNAFDPAAHVFYCSAVPQGMSNVTIGGAIIGVCEEKHAKARQAVAERRAFIIARLKHVAEIWGWETGGFGGLESSNTEMLEQALVAAWQLPQGASLLTHGLGFSERRAAVKRLQSLTADIIMNRAPKRLSLYALGTHGHSVLIDPAYQSSEPADAFRAAVEEEEQAWDETWDDEEEENAKAECRARQRRIAMARLAPLTDGTPLWRGDAGGADEGGTSCGPSSERRGGRPEGGGRLAVIRQVVISRAITCSCPLQCGFLLAHRGPLTVGDLYSGSLSALDDVWSIEQLRASISAGLIPPITKTHTLSEATLCELDRPPGGGGGGPYPIAWFRFDCDLAAATARAAAEPGWLETGRLECTLEQPRTTSLLLVRLVGPEDRMTAMHDDHAETNIDVEYVGVRGLLLG